MVEKGFGLSELQIKAVSLLQSDLKGIGAAYEFRRAMPPEYLVGIPFASRMKVITTLDGNIYWSDPFEDSFLTMKTFAKPGNMIQSLG